MNSMYKGKLLISTPDISGDIFSRSVVLVIDHNPDGSFGLILNKKNQELSKTVRKIFGFSTDIYEGGPVENNKTFIIVKGSPVVDLFIPITSDFYITEDVEGIASAVIEGVLRIEDVKVFSGYSGWGPSQLDSEVSRKMWTPVDVFNLDYTTPNDQNLWKTIMQNLGGEFLLWANAPSDISWN